MRLGILFAGLLASGGGGSVGSVRCPLVSETSLNITTATCTWTIPLATATSNPQLQSAVFKYKHAGQILHWRLLLRVTTYASVYLAVPSALKPALPEKAVWLTDVTFVLPSTMEGGPHRNVSFRNLHYNRSTNEWGANEFVDLLALAERACPDADMSDKYDPSLALDTWRHFLADGFVDDGDPPSLRIGVNIKTHPVPVIKEVAQTDAGSFEVIEDFLVSLRVRIVYESHIRYELATTRLFDLATVKHAPTFKSLKGQHTIGHLRYLIAKDVPTGQNALPMSAVVLWIWARRQNGSTRPGRRLDEFAQCSDAHTLNACTTSIEASRDDWASVLTNDDKSRSIALFVQVLTRRDFIYEYLRPVVRWFFESPSQILVFIKCYHRRDPRHRHPSVVYRGYSLVHLDRPLHEMSDRLLFWAMTLWSSDGQEVHLLKDDASTFSSGALAVYEEVSFESGGVQLVNMSKTPRELELQSGDILILDAQSPTRPQAKPQLTPAEFMERHRSLGLSATGSHWCQMRHSRSSLQCNVSNATSTWETPFILVHPGVHPDVHPDERAAKEYSPIFKQQAGLQEYVWCILFFPFGDNVETDVSLYLMAANADTLPSGWARSVYLELTIHNQHDPAKSVTKTADHTFKADSIDWGFREFMPRSELLDPDAGFVVRERLLITAYVQGFNETEYEWKRGATPSAAIDRDKYMIGPTQGIEDQFAFTEVLVLFLNFVFSIFAIFVRLVHSLLPEELCFSAFLLSLVTSSIVAYALFYPPLWLRCWRPPDNGAGTGQNDAPTPRQAGRAHTAPSARRRKDAASVRAPRGARSGQQAAATPETATVTTPAVAARAEEEARQEAERQARREAAQEAQKQAEVEAKLRGKAIAERQAAAAAKAAEEAAATKAVEEAAAAKAAEEAAAAEAADEAAAARAAAEEREEEERTAMAKARGGENTTDVPSDFLCPITTEIMRDPVITIADGLTYERAAIEQWLARFSARAGQPAPWTSPLTGAKLSTPQLAPNVILRSQIIRFLEEHPECNEDLVAAAPPTPASTMGKR